MTMSNLGTVRNYRNGRKNNWRATVWNEILRRTKRREISESILYLPGTEDIDREVAVRKGVPFRNLIAVEHDRSNVKKLRRRGIPVIHGDLLEVLWSWPKHRKVASIFADFCSGVEFGNAGLWDVLDREPFRDAVVMVNFQRGRDRWSNTMRELINNARMLDGFCINDAVVNSKHRALQFLIFHCMNEIRMDCSSEIEPISVYSIPVKYGSVDESGLRHEIPKAGLPIGFREYILGNLYWCKPRFYSYNSGKVVMDSVVFNARLSPIHDHVEFKDWLDNLHSNLSEKEQEFSNQQIYRNITAMFAVLSRRFGKAA